MTAFLIVRAEVDAAVRDGFDAWYREEHLPEAVEALGASGAWRGWSPVEEGVHFAFYEFASLAEVERAMASDAIRALIAEFDRHWEGSVTRTREAVESIQSI